MPSTFFLAPSPKWYFFDSDGQLAINGTIETYSSLDHVTPKPVYSDVSGSFPYANPIQLDGSGGTPVPLYWEENGVDLYYVVIRDESGNIIATINKYPIVGSGGGTPPVTQNTDIENHIINGQFHLRVNDIFDGSPNTSGLSVAFPLPITPVPQGISYVAPGGGATSAIRDNFWLGGRLVDEVPPLLAPGWSFRKTGGPLTGDAIRFVEIDDTAAGAPGLGFTLPAGPSANAPRYFEYEATSTVASTELDLIYLIPNVTTFANETITVSFDCSANVASGATEIIINQNFGTGGSPSVEVNTASAFSFPNGTWERITKEIVVPNINGSTRGTNGDDFLAIRIRFPVNTIGRFMATNLQVQIGTDFGLAPFIYQTFNQTEYQSVMELIYASLPKTGDIKFSYSNKSTGGWIAIGDDGETLGNAASGASVDGPETRNLFILIWDSFDDSLAPVSTGRGASAIADFNANKTIGFPAVGGRVIGAVGTGTGLTGRTLGELAGEEMHTLTKAEIPAHVHTVTQFNELNQRGSGSSAVPYWGDTTVANTGDGSADGLAGDPHNVMQPTTFYNLHVKL